MILYVVSAALSSILAFVYQKMHSLPKNLTLNGIMPRVVISASCILLIILAGTRINVGVDYQSYAELFRGIGKGQEYSLEPGYIWLNKVIFYFTENPQWLFFISSAITLVLMYRFIIKYSVNIAYSVFLYFGLCFIFFSFNTLRQFIAVGIALLAFGPLLERKFLRYASIVLLASAFHLTALVMLPIYIFVNVRFTKFKMSVISTAAIGLYLARDSIISLFFWLYPMHQENEFLLNRVEFSEILIATSFLLLLMIRKILKSKKITYEGSDRIYINIVLLIFFTHIAFAWVPGINRVTLYLDVLLLVIIPYIISRFPRARSRDLIIISIAYFSIYAFFSTYINNSHQALPYNSVLIPNYSTYEGIK